MTKNHFFVACTFFSWTCIAMEKEDGRTEDNQDNPLTVLQTADFTFGKRHTGNEPYLPFIEHEINALQRVNPDHYEEFKAIVQNQKNSLEQVYIQGNNHDHELTIEFMKNLMNSISLSEAIKLHKAKRANYISCLCCGMTLVSAGTIVASLIGFLGMYCGISIG